MCGDIMSALGVFSALRDIISALGAINIAVENLQCTDDTPQKS